MSAKVFEFIPAPPPRVGQRMEVRGQFCIIRRVLPMGTVEVESASGKWFRVSGLLFVGESAPKAFQPFTDAELAGMSPAQLAIELQFLRAVYCLLAVLAPVEHTLTPVIGGEVRGL